MQHTATRSTMQHNAMRSTMQHTATRSTMQHTATRSTMQHTATRSTIQHIATWKSSNAAQCNTLQHAAHCTTKTLQHTTTRSTLQLTATHCTMQHTATWKSSDAVAIWKGRVCLKSHDRIFLLCPLISPTVLLVHRGNVSAREREKKSARECVRVPQHRSQPTQITMVLCLRIYTYIYIYINLQRKNIKRVLLRSGCSFGTRLLLRQHTTPRPAIYAYTYTCTYICMVNTQKNTNQKRDMSHNLPESHMKTRAIASRPSPTATTRWYGNAKQISNANVRVSVCSCMCPCVRWMRMPALTRTAHSAETRRQIGNTRVMQFLRALARLFLLKSSVCLGHTFSPHTLVVKVRFTWLSGDQAMSVIAPARHWPSYLIGCSGLSSDQIFTTPAWSPDATYAPEGEHYL